MKTTAFASRLRELREAAKLTQHDLATRIGVRESQINSYERGRAVPRVERLARIAEAVGGDVSELATLAVADADAGAAA